MWPAGERRTCCRESQCDELFTVDGGERSQICIPVQGHNVHAPCINDQGCALPLVCTGACGESLGSRRMCALPGLCPSRATFEPSASPTTGGELPDDDEFDSSGAADNVPLKFPTSSPSISPTSTAPTDGAKVPTASPSGSPETKPLTGSPSEPAGSGSGGGQDDDEYDASMAPTASPAGVTVTGSSPQSTAGSTTPVITSPAAAATTQPATHSPLTLTVSIEYDMDFSTLFPDGDTSAFELVIAAELDDLNVRGGISAITISQGSVIVELLFDDQAQQSTLVTVACAADWTVTYSGYELQAMRTLASGAACPTASPTLVPSWIPTRAPSAHPSWPPTLQNAPSQAPSAPEVNDVDLTGSSNAASGAEDAEDAEASSAAATVTAVLAILAVLVATVIVAGVVVKHHRSQITERGKRERGEAAHGPVAGGDTGKNLTLNIVRSTAHHAIVSSINPEYNPTAAPPMAPAVAAKAKQQGSRLWAVYRRCLSFDHMYYGNPLMDLTDTELQDVFTLLSIRPPPRALMASLKTVGTRFISSAVASEAQLDDVTAFLFSALPDVLLERAIDCYALYVSRKTAAEQKRAEEMHPHLGGGGGGGNAAANENVGSGIYAVANENVGSDIYSTMQEDPEQLDRDVDITYEAFYAMIDDVIPDRIRPTAAGCFASLAAEGDADTECYEVCDGHTETQLYAVSDADPEDRVYDDIATLQRNTATPQFDEVLFRGTPWDFSNATLDNSIYSLGDAGDGDVYEADNSIYSLGDAGDGDVYENGQSGINGSSPVNLPSNHRATMDTLRRDFSNATSDNSTYSLGDAGDGDVYDNGHSDINGDSGQGHWSAAAEEESSSPVNLLSNRRASMDTLRLQANLDGEIYGLRPGTAHGIDDVYGQANGQEAIYGLPIGVDADQMDRIYGLGEGAGDIYNETDSCDSPVGDVIYDNEEIMPATSLGADQPTQLTGSGGVKCFVSRGGDDKVYALATELDADADGMLTHASGGLIPRSGVASAHTAASGSAFNDQMTRRVETVRRGVDARRKPRTPTAINDQIRETVWFG